MASVLLEAGVVFAALAVGGALASRLGQSVIPAYILGGVALGPYSPVPALALVQTSEFITLLQELGIVLLLFFIGLEFSPEKLAASRDQVLRAGTIDLLVNAPLGFALGLLLGLSALESLFLAGIVYISSSAVITKSLIELGWVADPEAQPVLGVLVFEDLVVAVYLAVLAALALSGTVSGALVSLGVAVAVILALAGLAVFGSGLLERVLDTRSDELFLVRVVALAALIGGLALSLGVSEAVAAFFLGMAVGSTSHVERIERIVTSERDLFAAVFFFAIGLATDPRVVLGVAAPLALLAAVTAVGKLVSGYLGGRAYGLDERRSARVAVAMVARGEFSLVIAALAVQANLSPTLSALAVGYVLVMSVLGTLAMGHSAPIERLAVRRATRTGGESEPRA
jgi:CPA2 family monovalent cation:H+ antiporter-2